MHVENIVSKASKRLYMLYQVKRAGSDQKDLLKIYLSVIRPVLEYACPVWHPHLPKYLCDTIECIQKRALRCIYPGRLYEDLLGDLHITSLQERRDSICKEISTLFQSLAANATVFSQQLMRAGIMHVLRRILLFRWLGQTVLRIHLSHGSYVNFKVNFSLCVSSQFLCASSFFFNSAVWYVVFTLFYIILSMSTQPYGCKDNKILSYLLSSVMYFYSYKAKPKKMYFRVLPVYLCAQQWTDLGGFSYFCQKRLTLGIRVVQLQMIITLGLELSCMIKHKGRLTINWIVYVT